jgi:hypothetical protein
MPAPRGRKSRPTRFSKTELLPALYSNEQEMNVVRRVIKQETRTCEPTTTICGNCIFSEPTVLNTS